jgi:hypothetical protein
VESNIIQGLNLTRLSPHSNVLATGPSPMCYFIKSATLCYIADIISTVRSCIMWLKRLNEGK